MPIITNGSNATVAVSTGQILTVQSDQGAYDFENPVGTRIGEYSSDMTFGPFTAAASVKITSVQGTVFYELASSGTVPAGTLDVTASRDLTAADLGVNLRCNSASTISLNLTTTLPRGFNCAVTQYGAGKVTITAGAGVTLRSAASLASTSVQYATVGVLPLGTSEYVLSGSLGV